MLQVARLAPTLLGESAGLVSGFLRRTINSDGGFADRAGNSDLYYTVFGLEALLAVHAQLPLGTPSYLRRFREGQDLDFVHLTCLARAWATLTREVPHEVADAIRNRLEGFRAGDGGFALTAGADTGTVYACFLALGALEDLGGVREDDRMRGCVESLRASDGGYANHPGASEGSTPATAAAVMVLRHFGASPDSQVRDWLLARAHHDGGFFAAARAPVPDLLSTATALHALSALQADLTPLREPCLDFIDSLWTNTGGFCGSWADETQDCEYTYYGLLALGHLSL